jgi:hypothetical protein
VNARYESYLVWNPAVATSGGDIDFWVLEPSGNLYIPFLGTVTPNGDFTPESAAAGTSYEGWITKRYLQVGHYAFYANLWADPSGLIPAVNLLFRNDQVSALTPLYAAGSEPQLSTSVSWLNDPTPTFAEVDGGAYTDLRPVAVMDIAPPSALKASLPRPATSTDLQPQVLGPVQSALRPTTPGSSPLSLSAAAIGPTRTVTPAITASQFATARRVLGARSMNRRSHVRTLETRP